MLREEHDGVMVPAWLEPKSGVIVRDDVTINKMVEVAGKLWAKIGGQNGEV